MSPRCNCKNRKNSWFIRKPFIYSYTFKNLKNKLSYRKHSYFFYFCDMKVLYILLGTLSLLLGIIGIFLPLLPTTPFLLLTAALYVRSSSRLYDWLLSQKYLGPYIRNFRENKAIPLKAKIISVSLIWTTMLYCIFFILPYWWLKVMLLLIATGTTYHILSFKTVK